MFAVECAARETGRSYVALYDAGSAIEAVNAAARDGHLASRAVEVVGGTENAQQPIVDSLYRLELQVGQISRADVLRRPRRTLVEGLWVWVLTVLAAELVILVGLMLLFGGLGALSNAARRSVSSPPPPTVYPSPGTNSVAPRGHRGPK